MIELRDTVQKMQSTDYKARFIAEYYQTKIRYEKLKAFNNKIEASEVTDGKIKEPKHDCPSSVLKAQQRAMGEYLHLLEVRAVIEDIDLSLTTQGDTEAKENESSFATQGHIETKTIGNNETEGRRPLK